MDVSLRILGFVRSPLTDRSRAPKMECCAGAPDARIELDPALAEALDGLAVGQEVLLLTWLHLSDRTPLKVHPRGDPARPLRGVFATRSPDRPNPIGLHQVRILAIEPPATLKVGPLEALDGTPVLDIKPLRREEPPASGS
jgi:L-fuculose-phosphate aldolase